MYCVSHPIRTSISVFLLLAAYTARDRVRNDGDDTKTKGFLTKIARLDDELAAAK